MKAARFDYQRPDSVARALELLADDSAKAIAGGQSLGPMLNLRLARPATVVDISGLEELRGVSVRPDGLQIGAAVTHAQIEDGVFAPLRGHPVQRVARVIAYRGVRNRGTIGGSLAHADPAADWVIVLTALGAVLSLATRKGTREVAMADFMQGAYTTALASDELITSVRLPAWGEAARWGYYKICRKTGEFAEASCAAVFDPQQKLARVVLGALDGPPQPLPGLAATVAREGALADRPAILAAVRAAAPGKDAVDCGLYATAVERCLAQALRTDEVTA